MIFGDRKAKKLAQIQEQAAVVARWQAMSIPELAEQVAVALWGPDGPRLFRKSNGDEFATDLMVVKAMVDHAFGGLPRESSHRQDLMHLADEGMNALIRTGLVATKVATGDDSQEWSITRDGQTALDAGTVGSTVEARQSGG